MKTPKAQDLVEFTITKDGLSIVVWLPDFLLNMLEAGDPVDITLAGYPTYAVSFRGGNLNCLPLQAKLTSEVEQIKERSY